MVSDTLRRILLSVSILLAAWPPAARAEDGSSGWYGEMLLSVQGDQVSGAFSSARGMAGGPMFNCAFLLQGRLVAGHAEIVTWTPGDETVIKGVLTLAPPKALLRLQVDPPGCTMTVGGMTREDYSVQRQPGQTGWVGVGMVGARRAVLQGSPGPNSRHAPYLVRFDAVAILRRQAGWARIRFLGSTKPVEGWLRESDLFPYTAWPSRVSEQ